MPGRGRRALSAAAGYRPRRVGRGVGDGARSDGGSAANRSHRPGDLAAAARSPTSRVLARWSRDGSARRPRRAFPASGRGPGAHAEHARGRRRLDRRARPDRHRRARGAHRRVDRDGLPAPIGGAATEELRNLPADGTRRRRDSGRVAVGGVPGRGRAGDASAVRGRTGGDSCVRRGCGDAIRRR